MKAQELYDYREESGAISGEDLHELFRLLCDGEPSPSGKTEILPESLTAIATGYRQAYADHKASGGVGGQYLLDIAEFAERFV